VQQRHDFSEPHYRTFLDMVERYRNFFADVSALTLPNRSRMLLRLRRHQDVHDRLLFGTDYPLSVFLSRAGGGCRCESWARSSKQVIVSTGNIWF
jgi:hypothetical protein